MPREPNDARAQATKPSDTSTDLGNAQSVRLRFSDFPNLTGEYRIAADYTIAIPAVGRIAVRGLNARSVEELVAQKVSPSRSLNIGRSSLLGRSTGRAP